MRLLYIAAAGLAIGLAGCQQQPMDDDQRAALAAYLGAGGGYRPQPQLEPYLPPVPQVTPYQAPITTRCMPIGGMLSCTSQ